jgi:hypothetical protein
MDGGRRIDPGRADTITSTPTFIDVQVTVAGAPGSVATRGRWRSVVLVGRRPGLFVAGGLLGLLWDVD